MVSTSESQHKMEGWLFLNVVIRKSSSVLKLLSSEDKSLLVWRDSFLILDLGFNILNGVSWFNIKGDGFTSEGLYEDLHTSSESENQVKSGLLLDVVVWKSSSIFKLLSGEDKSLLVWWNSFFVLNLGFNIFNCISWLNIKSDGFSSKSLDEDLHTSSKSEDQVESGLFLNIVVWKSSSIFKLLSSKDKSLLIWWNTFLILDFSFDILNGVCWFNIKGDGFTCEGLDEDLHTSSKSEDQVESGLFLDVVIGEGSAVFELLTSKDESLLIWWDSFLVLDLSLNVFNGVCWLDIKGDCFSCECFDENLHFCFLLFKVLLIIRNKFISA